MTKSSRKVWFVTGASTTFGLAVTENALQRGDNVVAILSTPEELSDIHSNYPSQLLLLSSDVRDPDQARAAFDSALERFGQVDVVLNNAGFCIISEAEGMSEEQGRDMFEMLFWGAVNVSKEAVKTFRDRNSTRGGRLLQVSSCTTLKAVAGVSHYAAAKSALECFSQGIAAELDPSWSIKISIIQPTLFWERTPGSTVIEPVHPAYSDPHLPSMITRNFYPGTSVVGGHKDDPRAFANAMYRLACMDDPPVYLPLNRVAIGAAKAKGEELIQTADDYASWSDDVYLSKS